MALRQFNVKKYLSENNIFGEYRIVGVRSGLSNCNYIIEVDEKKYIFRVNKVKESKATNSLLEEYNVLKFFEKQGFDFVPRSFHFDAENNVHILNYIEGRKVRFKNISPKGMRQAIEKLHEINSLARVYREFCIKEKIVLKEPKSEIERVRGRILEKLKPIRKDNLFYDVKKKLEKLLQKDFADEEIEKEKVYLNHGDPADNIIIKKDKVHIIDWEYVRLTYGPGLVHILAHGGLSAEKEERLLQYYSKISGDDIDFLRRKTYQEKNIYYLLKIVKICFYHDDHSSLGGETLQKMRIDVEKLFARYEEIKKEYLK